PDQHPDAGGDQEGLDRLLLDVLLEGLFHLHGAAAPFLVVLAGLVAHLFVLLAGLVADLGADVAEILLHLGGGFAQIGFTLGFIYAGHSNTPFEFLISLPRAMVCHAARPYSAKKGARRVPRPFLLPWWAARPIERRP